MFLVIRPYLKISFASTTSLKVKLQVVWPVRCSLKPTPRKRASFSVHLRFHSVRVAESSLRTWHIQCNKLQRWTVRHISYAVVCESAIYPSPMHGHFIYKVVFMQNPPHRLSTPSNTDVQQHIYIYDDIDIGGERKWVNWNYSKSHISADAWWLSIPFKKNSI